MEDVEVASRCMIQLQVFWDCKGWGPYWINLELVLVTLDSKWQIIRLNDVPSLCFQLKVLLVIVDWTGF